MRRRNMREARRCESGARSLTPAEFLTARLAEDEERAKARVIDAPYWLDADRLLREVEAKRKILGRHSRESRESGPGSGYAFCAWCPDDIPWPCEDVHDLAAVWSDHPDYDKDWPR
jgi:Family of unknown function (DUF6221)